MTALMANGLQNLFSLPFSSVRNLILRIQLNAYKDRMTSALHHPHDSFAKQCLSNLAVAKDLLKPHLPPDIVSRINWNTFQLTNKSFVDKKLEQSHSDMVYKCLLDNDKNIYLYTLIEHQSTSEELLAFRMLKYNISLMDQHLNEGHRRLLIILNMCLYAGAESPYPYSDDLSDCFEDPELARARMFKSFKLIDLTVLTQELLESQGQADLLAILLKQAVSKTFLNWIKEHEELIKKLLLRVYAESGIIYILDQEAKHDAESIMSAIIEIAPTKKDIIITAARQLERRGAEKGLKKGMEKGIKKGMEQGMKKGMEKEKLSIAKNMLAKRLEPSLIREVTGLSTEALESFLKDIS
jgi:predicted transposase/invertase (TIGR01784 family)